MLIFLVFLDPVYLLLSSMAVLCHVIGLLQRALQGKAFKYITDNIGNFTGLHKRSIQNRMPERIEPDS